jgi:membrane protease YdiL (CAAX protease family)
MAPTTEKSPDLGTQTGEGSAPGSAAPTRTERALWAEVAAVLAVGVLPDLSGAIVLAVNPPVAPSPYWLSSVDLCIRNACISFVVLYLIQRSNERWATFGIVRPGFGDVVLGLALFLLGIVLWWTIEPLLPGDFGFRETVRSYPRLPVDYFLMVVTHAATGFSEELVVRAYLITRLERLLESRFQAVVLAAIAFASYHLYYGPGPTLIFIAIKAVVFGALYLLIRRVWPFAIAHMAFNIYVEVQHSLR